MHSGLYISLWTQTSNNLKSTPALRASGLGFVCTTHFLHPPLYPCLVPRASALPPTAPLKPQMLNANQAGELAVDSNQQQPEELTQLPLQRAGAHLVLLKVQLLVQVPSVPSLLFARSHRRIYVCTHPQQCIHWIYHAHTREHTNRMYPTSHTNTQ